MYFNLNNLIKPKLLGGMENFWEELCKNVNDKINNNNNNGNNPSAL